MRTLMLVAIAAISVAPAASQPAPDRILLDGPRPAATGRFRITTGARVEPSGYLTVEAAPDSPTPPPEPPRKAQNERTYYAELAGVSNEEAAKRMREQEALRPAFERILAQVRKKERGNFTAVELIHKPDWAYLLYFKRDPDRTLAKYTRNPRIKARAARYTSGELQKMAQPWIDRFDKERLLTGYGMNARHGTADLDMLVSEEEFAASAARNKWGSLAYFPREVGLYVDRQGYLALRTRASEPRHLGRIGERFSWAGPIAISEEAPMVRELRARCGNAPLVHLSVPESEALFLARYPHLRDPNPPPPPPRRKPGKS
jgi:hypothetical protein